MLRFGQNSGGLLTRGQRLQKGSILCFRTRLGNAQHAAATSALHQLACPGLCEFADRYGYLAALAPSLFYLGDRTTMLFLAQSIVKLDVGGIDLT